MKGKAFTLDYGDDLNVTGSNKLGIFKKMKTLIGGRSSVKRVTSKKLKHTWWHQEQKI